MYYVASAGQAKDLFVLGLAQHSQWSAQPAALRILLGGQSNLTLISYYLVGRYVRIQVERRISLESATWHW